MNKKVKITAIALVVIVLLVILVTCFSNKEDTNNINETEDTNNINETTVETTSAKEKIKTNSTAESEEETDTKEYATLPEVTETENNETTDYFQNVSVYEETTKKSKKSKKKNTDKNESEAYPGENDGWSPIVSPDDLD